MNAKDLDSISDEARKRYIDLPAKVVIRCDGHDVQLSDSQRLALCYLHGAMMALNKNGLLDKNWETNFNITFKTEEK